jgi:hypothetical protein
MKHRYYNVWSKGIFCDNCYQDGTINCADDDYWFYKTKDRKCVYCKQCVEKFEDDEYEFL